MAHPPPRRTPPPRRRKAPEAEGSHERWLVSYADMITLLFCLFILLYAMSKLNESKFQQLSHSLAKAITHEDNAMLPGTAPDVETDDQGKVLAVGNVMSRNQKPPRAPSPEPSPTETEEAREQRRLQSIALDIEGRIKQAGLGNAVSTVVEDEGLIIRIRHDRILFDLGDASVRPEGARIVRIVGGALRKVLNGIRIEGNTDDLPLLPGGRFQNNWELSAMRATNVAEILIRDIGLSPHRVSVLGHGQFKPTVPNSTETNRQLNRRVELCILRQHAR